MAREWKPFPEAIHPRVYYFQHWIEGLKLRHHSTNSFIPLHREECEAFLKTAETFSAPYHPYNALAHRNF